MRLRAIMLAVGILLLSIQGFSQSKRFVFTLKGGYYSPSSTSFNDLSAPLTNRELHTISSSFARAGYRTELNDLKKMSGGFTFGGELELFLLPRFSVALGTEFWRDRPSASLQILDSSTPSLQTSFFLNIEAILIPITTTIRYHIQMKRWDLYGGPGIGYYWSKFTLEWVAGESGELRIDSRGSAWLPHLNGGADFALSRSFSLALDIRYTFGRIDSFEIKSGHDTELAGSNLVFGTEQGTGQEYMWELNGFSLGLCFRVKF